MLSTAKSTQGMATAPHYLASEAGLRVLREGGTAIEATIAMGACLAVVYPHMTAIGGDGFWLVSKDRDAPVAIDACGAADYCINGNCTAPVQCQNNRQCQRIVPIFTCQQGVCQPPVNQCRRNSECAVGGSCVFGICAPLQSPECVRDVDCGGGQLCEGERCVAP